ADPRPSPPHPPQLLALFGRQPVALAGIDRRRRHPAPHRGLTQIELSADRRHRPLPPVHQRDDIGLELRREPPALPSACPVPLRLLPHPDSLHVGSRPHLECLPTGGKSSPTGSRSTRPTPWGRSCAGSASSTRHRSSGSPSATA